MLKITVRTDLRCFFMELNGTKCATFCFHHIFLEGSKKKKKVNNFAVQKIADLVLFK